MSFWARDSRSWRQASPLMAPCENPRQNHHQPAAPMPRAMGRGPGSLAACCGARIAENTRPAVANPASPRIEPGGGGGKAL